MRVGERPLVKSSDFLAEEMQEEILLYKGGSHKAIYLNETAALVWKLCDGTRTVDDIAAVLTENFSEPHVAHDVRQAIETLVREGILSATD
jgi:pyrroloquinoline quinone biosynthesis protein D